MFSGIVEEYATLVALVKDQAIASESPSLTREESSRLFYEVEKDYLDVKSKIKRFKEIRENPHFNADPDKDCWVAA